MIIFNNRHVILIFYEHSFIQKYCLPLNILKPQKIQETHKAYDATNDFS